MMTSKELYGYYQSEGISKHQFQTEHEHPFHKKRYTAIRKLMCNYAKGILLDIGCAEGWLTLWSLDHVDTAVGIDLSLPKLKRAVREARKSRTDFILASFDRLPFRKETFDTVIWSEGPEHAENPEYVFSEVAVLLRDDGVFLISTMGLHPPPGYRFLRRVMGQWKKEVQEWRRWGHVSTFTGEQLLKLISEQLEVETNMLLRSFILVPIRRVQNFLDSLVQRFTGKHVGSAWPGFGCMIVVARKRKD